MGAYIVTDKTEVDRSIEYAFTLFPRLKERAAQKGGTLSGGEQQMLAMARGLMSQPKLLMLDEPSMGLAPVVVELIFSTIERLHSEGITILLVEQNAHMALEVADHGYVMELGRIVLENSAAALRDDPTVQESYLGARDSADNGQRTWKRRKQWR